MAMSAGIERIDVPVRGGTLATSMWPGDGPVVIAAHGITANHTSWEAVARSIGGRVRLVAPDLRGRADSASLPGPWGMASHAADVLAIADHLALDQVLLVGHSMGGFVVANAAEAASPRVSGLVLVDGGLPIPATLPPDADVEAVVRSVIGPALDRLDLAFESVDAYFDFFRAHPAFRDFWSGDVEAYLRHDLGDVGSDGRWRSRARKDAVLQDGGAAITDPATATALERVTTPTTLLWCPRGLLDQTPGLYPPELVAATTARCPHVSAELVDSNHYTITLAPEPAARVAEVIVGRAMG
jgi:pimeloyl-ACP methyl ester carboxylesterase